MDWKYEAIDKLKRYSAKRVALITIPEELARLEKVAVTMRGATSDGSPVKGGGSAYEDRVLNNIARREELKKNLVLVKRWLSPVEKALADLDDKERLVLDRFFIHPAKGNVDRLCEELGYEKATVYRKRDEALYSFTMALYGCTDT